MNYPEEFKKIIDFYKSLPGIGEKNAERLAIATYEMDDNKINTFISDLKKLKTDVKKCSICGNITCNDICSICSDDSRDKNLICILEDFKNLLLFEKSKIYNGTYHIIGGLISPINGIGPDDLNFDTLINRVKENPNCEVVFALKSSIEGQMTMLYIKELLSKYKVKMTRLSYGVPIGMNLDYMDVLSLDKALEDRRSIDD